MPRKKSGTTRSKHKKSLQEILKRDFGLGKCWQEKCDLCEKYGGTDTLLFVRNAFIAGTLPSLLSVIFNVDGKYISQHAYETGWVKKRAGTASVKVSRDLITHLAQARLAATWQFAGPSSADKSLDLLAKIAGVGSNIDVKLEGNMSHSWDKIVQGNGQSEDVRDGIIVEDEYPCEQPVLAEPRETVPANFDEKAETEAHEPAPHRGQEASGRLSD